MARPRGGSPWRDRWFESPLLQQRVSSELGADLEAMPPEKILVAVSAVVGPGWR